MATPKKKTSVSRKGLRHAGHTHKLYRKFPITCPNCKDITLPHNACPSCGYYRGKELIKIKAATEEAADETTESSEDKN